MNSDAGIVITDSKLKKKKNKPQNGEDIWALVWKCTAEQTPVLGMPGNNIADIITAEKKLKK